MDFIKGLFLTVKGVFSILSNFVVFADGGSTKAALTLINQIINFAKLVKNLYNLAAQNTNDFIKKIEYFKKNTMTKL